jgi:hypothetical protein
MEILLAAAQSNSGDWILNSSSIEAIENQHCKIIPRRGVKWDRLLKK